MHRSYIVLASAILITGCAQQSSTNNAEVPTDSASGSLSTLSALRPKADPAVMEKMKQEAAAQQAQMAQQAGLPGQGGATGGAMVSGTGTSLSYSLPQTNVGGLAASQQAFAGGPQSPADDLPIITPADSQPQPAASNPFPFWPFAGNQNKPPEVATYGGGYGGGAVPPPPPGASAPGGLVPPPPAVSLSTSATTLPGGMPMDPYANPYMNPYAQQPAEPQRPALFGSGQRSGSEASDDDAGSSVQKKKMANFVPITPTGMEARSPYKQRDDLKVLWKGALAQSPVQKLAARDGDIAAQVAKIDVGLPAESTRGAFSVTPRQIDQIFKPVAIDKKVAATVKKLQGDLVQAYYRYLHAFNKFALAQQTVAARKQQVDFAGSPAEKQRAATDLAQAQGDADAAKEDMRAAQYELASVAGPQSARTIIGRVSGVAPSAESLAQGLDSGASQAPAAPVEKAAGSSSGGFLGGVGSLFGLGGGKTDAPAKAAKPDKKGKGKHAEPSGSQEIAAQSPAAARPEPEQPASAPEGPVAFELKNINITPKKAILKVAIRNNGGESFSFDPDVIALLEGNKKLPEATLRAEFDTTLVQPNQEVMGTITIYGRPWNDRLSLSLSEGGKTITMKR